MMQIRNHTLSALTFFGTLLGRRDNVLDATTQGYPLLAGWERSPEEDLVRQGNEALQAFLPRPRAVLFCYEGPHQGETLYLRRDTESIGSSSSHSVVITPDVEAMPATYFVRTANPMTISGEWGQMVRVNGVDVNGTEIFDYDKIDILGNRCVFLTLKEDR